MPKRLLAVAAAALGLTASAVVAAPTASADVPCRITGFTPTSVVVGLTPITKRFNVRTADCIAAEGWSVDVKNAPYLAFESAPYETFAPSFNDDAGPYHVVVEAHNSDYYSTERTFAGGFYLKHNMAWQRGSFNASPEPVRKGKPVRIKGRLLVANWETNSYTAANGRSVAVQFRTPTGNYATVKTVCTSGSGWVDTKVTAKRTGVWRVVYSGSSVAGPAVATGDSVKVK